MRYSIFSTPMQLSSFCLSSPTETPSIIYVAFGIITDSLHYGSVMVGWFLEPIGLYFYKCDWTTPIVFDYSTNNFH